MRILIADDHALFRDGMRRLLDEAYEHPMIVEAGSVAALLEAVDAEPFDLILLDLAMPGMSGPQDVTLLVRRAPNAFVVVVSASESQTDVVEAIRAGAVGFIPKASTPAVTLNILNLVLAGGIYMPAEFIKAFEPAASAVSKPPDQFTSRQREVLTLLVLGKANKEIARELDLSLSTVKLHVAAVLHALGAGNRTEAATAAIRQGIVVPANAKAS